MRRSLRRRMSVLMVVVIVTTGCSRAGSEFLGKWVSTKNAKETLDITRNGDRFLVVSASGDKFEATYKDGGLEVPGGIMGILRISYLRASDTLMTPGFFGQQEEYKRAN